jgi:hypothetical protein
MVRSGGDDKLVEAGIEAAAAQGRLLFNECTAQRRNIARLYVENLREAWKCKATQMRMNKTMMVIE